MTPFIHHLPRSFDAGIPSSELLEQWKHPSDIFSVLLILGGDVVRRALAQLVGSPFTPIAFSFGWVAYSVSAVVSAVGDNKLMPLPDCTCKVINARSGYVRDNSSWVLGRIMRDFEGWMDNGKLNGPIHQCVRDLRDKRWEMEKEKAEKKEPGSSHCVERPLQAGLCVSIYRSDYARPGFPGHDQFYFLGIATAFIQLGVAAVPCGIYGDWSILTITGLGILLSFAMGGLSQWKKEKWACRANDRGKTVTLTRGNGSQHAIVVVGDGHGLDLEDLAAGPSNIDVSSSYRTSIEVMILAVLWILLLITASAIKSNTWFLLAVGGIGMVQNIHVAGARRSPHAFGIPLIFEQVIGKPKVMATLFEVEAAYPGLGRSLLSTFFPGKILPQEEKKWKDLAQAANLGFEI